MDKTEELLNNQKQKKKIKSKYLIIIGGLIVLVIALIGAYFYYRSYQYDHNLNLGKKYLEDGDYDQAILAFNEAINIDDKKVEPYDYLIEVYVTIGDYDAAEEIAQKRPQTNEKLEGPNEVTTENIIGQILYGNLNGNINNSGLVVQKNLDDFLVSGEENTSTLLSLGKDGNKEIEKGSVGYLSERYSYLNLFGDKLYYYDGENIKVYNTLSGETENLNIPNLNGPIGNMLIYKGNLYLILYHTDLNYTQTLEKINLSNLSRTTILSPNTYEYILSFVISNDKIYYRDVTSDNLNFKVMSLDGESLGTLFSNLVSNEPDLFSLSGNNENVFVIYNLNNGYRNSVRKYNSKDNSFESVIEIDGQIDTINSDDSKIYYMVEGTLYQCDLNGDNTKEVYSPSEEILSYSGNYDTSGRYINLSDNYIYLEYIGHRAFEETSPDGYDVLSEDENISRAIIRINKNNLTDIEEIK